MRALILGSMLVLVVCALPEVANADRPIQRRETADYVVVGKVTKVYVHQGPSYRDFIVELQVEAVEKGEGKLDGLVPRAVFRPFCYQRTAESSLSADTAGHKSVPTAGQRVRVFVSGGTRLEGVYPDWYDVVPAEKK